MSRGRWTAVHGVVLGLGCVITAAASAEELQGTLQIKGSDTMVNLAQAWAEAFMTTHPTVVVAVTGGGSGTGIAALIAGTCDLAATSRQMKAKELELATSQGASPQEWTVALDGLAVVVHPDNPVRRLTLAQLADLFTGTLQTWQALGGREERVVLLSREVNSGTHVYFKEHVLGASAEGSAREFTPEALLLSSSQAIADEVAVNRAAIGYYGMGYLNARNVAVSVARTAEGPAVLPSAETVRTGAYPISRPLFLYTRTSPHGVVQLFLDFVRSSEGQRIVRQEEFVPMAGSEQP